VMVLSFGWLPKSAKVHRPDHEFIGCADSRLWEIKAAGY
jgi:hypothetical protein